MNLDLPVSFGYMAIVILDAALEPNWFLTCDD